MSTQAHSETMEVQKPAEAKQKKSAAPVVFAVIVAAITAVVAIRILIQPEALVLEQPPVVVSVSAPMLGTMERTITYSGTLLPKFNTTVIPKISGKVVQLLVQEGDTVEKDQLLFVIEDDIVSLQEQQAAAALAGAQAQLQKVVQGARPEEIENARALVSQAEEDIEVARANLDRTKNLFDAGTISRSRYEEAENQFNSAQTQLENSRRSLALLEEGARAEDISLAQANVDAAQKSLELAQIQVANTLVRAPVSGRIAAVLKEEGDLVGPSVAVAAIIAENDIFASVAIPEKYYPEFAFDPESIDTQVTPLAYEDLPPFLGKVTQVSPVIDAASRTFTVEIAVENDNGILRPGMYINARIILERLDNQIVVPTEATVTRNDETVVFVVREENQQLIARAVVIEKGLEQRGRVAISGDILATDSIIVSGNAFIEDGQAVRIAE